MIAKVQEGILEGTSGLNPKQPMGEWAQSLLYPALQRSHPWGGKVTACTSREGRVLHPLHGAAEGQQPSLEHGLAWGETPGSHNQEFT